MISFEYNNDVLDILVDNKKVFYISKDSELLYLFNGKNKYKMFHGSFKIKQINQLRNLAKIRQISLKDNVAKIKFDDGSFKIHIEGNALHLVPKGFSNYNRMEIKIPSKSDEGFYGLGENFTEFNFKGKKLNVWVAEHINVGQTIKKIIANAFGFRNTKVKQPLSNYETYYAQPTFISSEKYFFHSESTARTEFDFRNRKSTIIKIDNFAPFYFGFGKTYEELLTNLTNIIGRQPLLPDWVYDGQILGIQGGTKVMMDKYQKVKEHNGKVNGIWIQDWEGRRVTAVGKQLYWNWEWDEKLYPDLPNKIKELNKEGVKVLGYCNPFLALEKPLYKYATSKGYCVKDIHGKDYLVKSTTFPAAMVDLTNPEAYEWLKGIIKKNMIEFGLSGWMADFGEYLPTDSVLFDGESSEYIHNEWPVLWAKLNREALIETNNVGKILFFTRAGFSGTPRYSVMMWNGDNHPDFSIDYGLPSIIPAMLSLTCSGFGLSHSDIGGYTSVYNMRRDMEVYKRWFEMNAFSPLMRGHEGLNPDINVQFDHDEDILEFSSKMSRIHTCLKPYLKELDAYNANTGVGMVRPLFFYYNEEKAFNTSDEYLLGRDILVCPVTRPKKTKWEVYLPEDEWIHIWSKKEYKGGKYVVDAPLGQIPVFVRKNAKMDIMKLLEEEL